MNITIDRKFYLDSYLCGKPVVLPLDSFVYYISLAERETAVAVLDRDVPPEHEDRVKMCICALAELLFASDKNDTVGKTSERVGSYSVSYESNSEHSARLEREKRRVIRLWLADTGLLFLGV